MKEKLVNSGSDRGGAWRKEKQRDKELSIGPDGKALVEAQPC